MIIKFVTGSRERSYYIVILGIYGGVVLRKPNNDMDKIMDLFLYIFPKYLDKISEQRNIRAALKKASVENRVDKTIFKEDEFKDNKKNHNDLNKAESLKNDDKTISKGGDSEMGDRIEDGGITKGKDTDKDTNKDIDKDIGNDTDKDANKDIDKDVGKDTDKDVDKDMVKDISKESSELGDNDIINNEPSESCINGIEKILKELIGEKVDISITDSTIFLLNAVTILSVTDATVRLKTTLNTTIIVPIDEIVAIRCDLIYGISFEENCGLEVCKREESLKKYFTSIIGKKVSLHTKGDGEFKYINSRIITGTGNGIVIIEGTIAVSLSKIILIQEV